MKKQETIHIELLPSANAVLRAASGVDKAELDRLVEIRVREIMAERDALVFEPWFQTRQVAYAVKRLQTVPEQRKWTVYFNRYGCMICEIQDRQHAGNGMCNRCHSNVFQRVAQIIAEGIENKPARAARGTSAKERLLPDGMPSGLPVKLHKTWQKRSTKQERQHYARVAERLGVTLKHVRQVATGGEKSAVVLAALERDAVEQAHAIIPSPKPPWAHALRNRWKE